MADPIHTIKQGATRPGLIAVLKDSDGNPVDLSQAASVALQVAPVGEDEYSVDGAVMAASGGQISFDFEESDTSIPGTHRATIVVTWQDGATEGFPNPGDLWLRVRRNTGPD
jgi:hypothetical protein